MDNEYRCPLVEQTISDTICYDVQMVLGGMIKKSVLEDFDDPPVDVGKVSAEEGRKHCTHCAFNQLKQVVPMEAYA